MSRSGIVCYIILVLTPLFSCKKDTTYNTVIATDAHSINQGKIVFNQYCGSCHNFNFDGIGPRLGGITDSVSIDWLRDFISNPAKLMEAGDARAKRLHTKFKVLMPPFAGLGDTAINNIISYLHARKPAILSTMYADRTEVKNAIVDTIPLSDLVVKLKLIKEFPVSNPQKSAPHARIQKLDFEPHSGQSFILDMNSTLYRLSGDQISVYLDMSKQIEKFINQPGLSSGFASFAFHPEHYKNGLLYTAHTEPAATKPADFTFEDSLESALQFVILEWKTHDPNAVEFDGTHRELFRIDMVSKAHGVQEIAFNPSAKKGSPDYGLLYLAIGDAGAGENRYPYLLHSKNRAWGTLFRIDPLQDTSKSTPAKNGNYGIPKSNPFTGHASAIGEIYAFGFRNPHRIAWSQKGQLLVSNIGHADVETLDLVEAGEDYGWPYMEGRYILDPMGDLAKIYQPIESDSIVKQVSVPLAQFDRDDAKAIAGGYEYTGSIPMLRGKFIFGDIPSGNIYFIYTNQIQKGKNATIYEMMVSLDGKIVNLKDLNKNSRLELHFGQNAKGEMYLMTKADGKLYKIEDCYKLQDK
ncbi:MAG: PQQ-dependent sugar dehydrogenase [Saprospiraceae bacterium]|nr:PQQ-dependent sugar dehydrogenase [Saprospiraceae bacterium]